MYKIMVCLFIQEFCIGILCVCNFTFIIQNYLSGKYKKRNTRVLVLHCKNICDAIFEKTM